jgi:hypothetical protein
MKCHNLQFIIILCAIVYILLKSNKVLYHPETRRVSGIALSNYYKQTLAKDGGRGGRGCRAATPTQIEISKTKIVKSIVSKYFPHLPFSRNQQLHSTDVWYTGVLKNKITELGCLQKP